MAEIVLSAFLNVLFEKLASAAFKSIARYKGLDAQIHKLEGSLLEIQDVVTDASRKEITDQSVKRWLDNLQHLAYDIDDLLDDFTTEAMHRDFTHESEPITSKVKKLIPNCCTSFSGSTRMLAELDNISTKLQDQLSKRPIGLLSEKEETGSKDLNRKYQTSGVDASSIVGRQGEKDALVLELLRVESCDRNYSIVPIVGMGGVGKTTLAKLVYNEKKVEDYFELRAWVCVSDEFDSLRITKVIYQSVTQEYPKHDDLNLLQVDLKKYLRDKRFLLVLDDVWSERYEDWEILASPFDACVPGSKIIITTRKEQLIKSLGCDHLNQLQSLSREYAVSLLAQHALGVNTFDSHLSLKPHGEAIVKKCDGLPLALVALGRLLRRKKNEEEHWKEVVNSEIWRLQDGGGIVPALRLSYHDLSACLKQLFAYCSLFPKDYMFDKEELVQL